MKLFPSTPLSSRPRRSVDLERYRSGPIRITLRAIEATPDRARSVSDGLILRSSSRSTSGSSRPMFLKRAPAAEDVVLLLL